jgi:hypothetical protein
LAYFFDKEQSLNFQTDPTLKELRDLMQSVCLKYYTTVLPNQLFLAFEIWTVRERIPKEVRSDEILKMISTLCLITIWQTNSQGGPEVNSFLYIRHLLGKVVYISAVFLAITELVKHRLNKGSAANLSYNLILVLLKPVLLVRGDDG